MRYYNFALYASADQIKENTTINLREYAYENTIAAVNNYMYKRLDNDVCFFAYREEGNTIFAVFVYDEKRKNFADAFAHVTKMLKEDLSVNRIKADPYEVTMYQALDFLLEARRRDFSNITTRFIELSNLWIYNYYNNEKISFHYNFEERIAFQIEFEDYTTDELCDIAKLMASKKQMTITDAAMDKLRENFDIVRGEADYGNGRFVRKTLEEAKMNLAERVLQNKESEITKELITTIEVCDIPDMAARKRAVKRIGFAS